MNRSQPASRAATVITLALAAFMVLSIAVFTQAAHAVEDIEFRIVFPGNDCTTGSNKVVGGPADPFDIEACVTDGDDPVSDLPLTAVVTHVDGTIQVIDLTTGSDGVVLFEVVPIDEGATRVGMCIGSNCDHGEVVFEANSPPTEIPENLYTGPTSDMGPSQPVGDGEDDFDDPYIGGPAGPGLGDPAIDLKSFRYLGAQGGVAMFEYQLYGDPCSVFHPPPPFGQFSIEVYTAEGGVYSLTYRFVDDGLETYAFNEIAPLDMVDMNLNLCAGDSLVILNATGVDVPPGSSFTAGTWLSHDPLSSGYQDFVSGTFEPVAIEDEPAEATATDDELTDETATDETDTADGADSPGGTETAAPISTSGDEGDSFPIWIPLVAFGVVVGGYFLYRSTRADGTVALTTGVSEVTDADLAQYADGDLGSYTDVYAGAASSAGSVTSTTTDEDWAALLQAEDAIQETYLGDYRDLLTEVVSASQAYRSAIDLYKEKFVKIASGTTGLQGYLQRWAENQKTAQKQDVAFAIVTLVWGLGSLGLKTVQWISRGKTGRALASAADEAAAATDAAADAATFVDDVVDPSSQKMFDRYAAELGVDAEAWIARHGNDFTKADRALRNQVGLARGWHGITRNAEDVINRLLVNGRGAVGGRAAKIDPADVAKLKEWASVEGFWNGLATAAGEVSYDAVRSAGGSGPIGDVITLFYNADDLKFLKQLLAVDGDAVKLAEALGPAQVTALELMGSAGMTGATVVGLGGSLQSLGSGSGLTGGLDLGSYTDQFGGWVGSIEEGFGSAVLDGLWGLVTSPFETFSGITHTLGAQDRYIDFLEAHGTDLTEMGAALKAAVDALDRMAGAIDRADLDDPTSSLGGRSADTLRDLVDEMGTLEESASDEWRAEHSDDVDARRAHIEQKIADIERVCGGLQDQLLRIGQIRDWIDGLRTNPDGSLRAVTDLWNPEILARLGAADLMLNGMIGNALTGGSSPQPPSAPTDESPPPVDMFSDDYNPLGELDAMDDDAYEAEWREQMEEVFTETD